MVEKKRKKGCYCCGWFLVVMVLIAIGFGIYVAIVKPKQEAAVPGPPGTIIKKYSDALSIAMQFFEIQKAGKLENNRISWRGDSALHDGSEAKLDLSKGLYDAGDLMKFGFPMAFTATVLSWSILEYGDQMRVVNQLEPAQASLKWITDFLVNAHPSENVLYIQVGNPETDHSCWARPEDLHIKRPLTQVNTSAPGTEVAAETAAALASASLVFKAVNSTYSSSLLTHARQLFRFADRHRGFYSRSVPQVQTYYNSTGYGDELLWAASWLYHATGERSYFDYAVGENGEEFGNFGSPTWFSWDNKLAGTQVLLSRLSFFGPNDIKNSIGLQNYRRTAEVVMCGLLPNSPTATSSRTDSGLIWVSEWNALQHPVASSFLALLFSDYMLSSGTRTISCDGRNFAALDIRRFAVSQADYVLGSNPMEISYLVGYGNKYPEFIHHRGASIPADANATCKAGFRWLESSDPNPNVATGALAGGPFLNETFVDSRNNSMQTEPTTYNSAYLVGLLSGLVTTSSVVTSFR